MPKRSTCESEPSSPKSAKSEEDSSPCTPDEYPLDTYTQRCYFCDKFDAPLVFEAHYVTTERIYACSTCAASDKGRCKQCRQCFNLDSAVIFTDNVLVPGEEQPTIDHQRTGFYHTACLRPANENEEVAFCFACKTVTWHQDIRKLLFNNECENGSCDGCHQTDQCSCHADPLS